MKRELPKVFANNIDKVINNVQDVFYGSRDKIMSVEDSINSIFNNTVFRLELNLPNLGTQILAMWRKQIARDWEKQYGVQVHGFETFVIEDEHRKGSMYRADNWDFVGETAGSTKTHNGMINKSERLETEKKLIFVKKIPKTSLCTEYKSTWRGTKEISEYEFEQEVLF